MTYEFKGKHYIASFKGMNYKPSRFIISVVKLALEQSNINILSYQEYYFDNNAVTFVFLLSESHCAVHTYPEHNSMFIDCFTCGSNFDIHKFHNILVQFLDPSNPQEYQIINRN